ncbi:zinc-binding dehydrogenase [Mycolicibacterium sp. lyk4-40-TYG-92]|uniref:quinone oxidoreductase family protein n=1 Tax=Mycolicibacterium sp. lyk4-40-TYG-92 TaxID=3040295 RepID=UPI00255020D7|nr:zinc-binding dehydrogenase [Mycolicibacterium sp. lyk4-40-TYG-92]
MRTVRVSKHGPPEVLEVIEVLTEPLPPPGHVTIDVAYAGVNFADAMFRRGALKKVLPLVPGIEVSGWIRDVGTDVTQMSAGQPVAALTIVNLGGYADIVTVDARMVVPLPHDSDSLLQRAAGTPSNTTTAIMSLDRAQLRQRETILIHSAASGLGSQLSQIAAQRGAGEIIGTVGAADKLPAARSFGCTSVMLRDEWLSKPTCFAQPDVIVDPVGGPTRIASIQTLQPDGRIVVLGNASKSADVPVGANELFLTSRTVVGFSLGRIAADRPDAVTPALAEAIRLVSSGAVDVPINAIVELADAAEAHRRIESGATTGKTVLRVRK